MARNNWRNAGVGIVLMLILVTVLIGVTELVRLLESR